MNERCELCGEPKPETVHHLWACCGDGPRLAEVTQADVDCLRRRLAASEAECERLRREVEERDAKLAASAQLNCDLASQNCKLIERNRNLGDTAAPWLPPQPQPSERVEDSGEEET